MYCFHALQYFQEVMELPLLLQTTVVVGGLISLRTYMIELEDWKAGNIPAKERSQDYSANYLC